MRRGCCSDDVALRVWSSLPGTGRLSVADGGDGMEYGGVCVWLLSVPRGGRSVGWVAARIVVDGAARLPGLQANSLVWCGGSGSAAMVLGARYVVRISLSVARWLNQRPACQCQWRSHRGVGRRGGPASSRAHRVPTRRGPTRPSTSAQQSDRVIRCPDPAGCGPRRLATRKRGGRAGAGWC